MNELYNGLVKGGKDNVHPELKEGDIKPFDDKYVTSNETLKQNEEVMKRGN